ncbi:MAG: hypothetical protein HY205_04305 [Nitrospirae bacterium]|nr:hypothetical protein [Nitrospirota bacterium]
MSKPSMQRPSAKRSPAARTAPARQEPPTSRRSSGRAGKAQVIERIQSDTREVHSGSLLTTLKRQGYEELPLEEIQDRLSKLRTSLAEFVISKRG